MSTGLTWVTLYDIQGSSVPDGTGSMIVFSDYDEAKKFALWNARYAGLSYGGNQLAWTLYTSSPNDNGYILSSTSPVFTAFT